MVVCLWCCNKYQQTLLKKEFADCILKFKIFSLGLNKHILMYIP